MNDNEKLSAFRHKVIGRVNDESAALASEAYERKKEALAVRRNEADTRVKAAYAMRAAKAEEERSANHSRATLERSKEYLALRDDITDKVLALTEEKVKAFAGGDEYSGYMRSLCERVARVFTEPFTLAVRQADMSMADDLKLSAGEGCREVVSDDSIVIGGAKFRAASGSVVVNETLEENLAHARDDLMLLMGKYLRTDE